MLTFKEQYLQLLAARDAFNERVHNKLRELGIHTSRHGDVLIDHKFEISTSRCTEISVDLTGYADYECENFTFAELDETREQREHRLKLKELAKIQAEEDKKNEADRKLYEQLKARFEK